MSGLDMVLQRQVPVRPAGKAGESSVGAGPGAEFKKDAFSAVLSGEKRVAGTARDRQGALNDPDAEGAEDTGAVVADEPAIGAEGATRSDEMLVLLEGLTSSAAYFGDAQTGADSGGLTEAPLSVVSNQAGAETADELGIRIVQPGASPSVKPEPADADRPETTAHGAATAVPASTATTAAATATATAAVPAAPATAAAPASTATAAAATATATAAVPAAPATVAAPAAPATAAVPSALVALGAAAGRGGQAAPTPAKSSQAEAPPVRLSAISEVNEIRRVLGLDSEARPVKSAEGKTTPDERTIGRPASKGADPERMPDDRAEIKPRLVEVVESRRSLANQSLTGNTQLLTRAIMEAGDIALSGPRSTPAAQAAIIPGQTQPGQMLQTLKIQLNPLSLGSVTAELKLSGEKLSVAIKVETAAAFRQLNDDNQSILKALRAQGYGVEQITIQHVAAPDRPATLAQQPAPQPGSQGAGSGDAQASGREASGQSAGQRGNDQHEGQHREQSPYSGSGSVRSDGVYL